MTVLNCRRFPVDLWGKLVTSIGVASYLPVPIPTLQERRTNNPSLFFNREDTTGRTGMNIYRMSYRNLELPRVPFRKHDLSVVSRVKYKFWLTDMNKIQILPPEVTNPGCDLGHDSGRAPGCNTTFHWLIISVEFLNSLELSRCLFP